MNLVVGVPGHALEAYCQRLIHAGYRVAVSEPLNEAAHDYHGTRQVDCPRVIRSTPGIVQGGES